MGPLAWLQVGLLLAMAATVATKSWQDHPWLGVALSAVTVLAWLPEIWRPRMRRWWFVYVAGTFIYTLFRSIADETAMPVRTDYPIRLDHLFLGGTDPVVWLQQRWFDPSHLTWLDSAAVMVHWSFFIAPHLAAVLIFLFRRELFARYAVLVVGSMYLSLVLFFLVPTAPPWLAAQSGALPGAFRVMDFVGGRVHVQTYQSFYAALAEPNSVAAMPSLHMAITVAMLLWALDHHRRLAPLLAVYALLMALALMYLAEHYLVDIVAGAGLALALHLVVRRLVPAGIDCAAPVESDAADDAQAARW
jgi:membrane-associated phospholipid phosphatase